MWPLPLRLRRHEALSCPATSEAAHNALPHPAARLVSPNERDEPMISRKLAKPAAAAAAAIAVAGGSYATSGVLLGAAPGADQIQKASDRRASVDSPVQLRRSAAAIGLAQDFGITRAAAQQLIESTYR
jgi:hypothetical protein